MTQQPLVSIIVATYNRWDLLQRWLESIEKQSYTNVEVIVVDNGSDTETEENMRRYSSTRSDDHRIGGEAQGSSRPVSHDRNPGRHSSNSNDRIIYIKPGTNTGFAGGNNLGANEATGKYLFLLNNDAFLGKDTLSDIVAYAEQHPNVAVMQPTILIGDGTKNLPQPLPAGRQASITKGGGSSPFAKGDRGGFSPEQFLSNGAGSFLTKWGFLWHRGYQSSIAELPQEPDEIFTALGAGMLIRADSQKKHFLFDESFFAYFEETDFCWRLWTRGFKIAYVPTDPMWHIGGQTAKVFKEKAVIFYSYRNRLIALWRHLELGNLIPILFFHHVAIVGVMLALIFKRPAASGWLLLVLGWEIVNLPMLLITRSDHLKRRTVSDKEIWSKIYRERSLGQMMQYLKG